MSDTLDDATAPEARDATGDRSARAAAIAVAPGTEFGVCTVQDGWSIASIASGPGCALLVPDDVKLRVPPLHWLPCRNGRTRCKDLTLPAGNPLTERIPTDAWVNQVGPKLRVGLRWDQRFRYEHGHYDASCKRTAMFEVDADDVLQTLAAWEDPQVDYESRRSGCKTSVVTGRTHTTFEHSSSWSHASRDIRLDPLVLPLELADLGVGGNGMPGISKTSDKVFGSGAGYGIARQTIGTGTVVFAATPGQRWMSVGLVEGDDVFAETRSDEKAWKRWYRADADGQLRLAVEAADAHVIFLRSDGANLFWMQASGNPPKNPWPGSNIWPQPHVEVWTAPHVSDLTEIRANARRLADVSGLVYSPAHAAAFNGMYAFPGKTAPSLNIMRAKDGAMQSLDIGPLRTPIRVAYITETEVWVHYFHLRADGSDYGLARIELDPWP